MTGEATVQQAMRVLDELLTHDSWSRDRLLEQQSSALRRIVRHAVERSPYYREALGAGAGSGDVRLEELPTLSKSTLMDEWDRIVTDRRLRRADAERYLARETGADLLLGEYRILATGGSTGQRGIFAYGTDEFATALAGMLRALATVGITPATRLASIGSPSPAHLTSHVFAVFRAGRAGSPRLTVDMPLDELVRALNAYRPEAILTYPSILRLLADEQLEGRLRIRPRTVGTSSEALTDDARERAAAAWNVVVNDAYASTEGGMMATECAAHCGLHVWEDALIVEVVDELDRPVPAGAPGSKVLLTNLWNHTQPLIRYELADAITIAAGENPTGRPFLRIADVEGRTADILRLPASAGGEVPIHPIRLRTPFAQLPEVRQYQFQVTDPGLRVRVVLTSDRPEPAVEKVRDALADALRSAGAAPLAIEVEPVDAIPRVGSGAKLTLVDSGARPERALAR